MKLSVAVEALIFLSGNILSGHSVSSATQVDILCETSGESG